MGRRFAVPARHQLLFCAALVCLATTGCAVYTPTQVHRWGFDYNTERQLAGYVATYDHLPPRPVRMRLTKWAYNVGPSQSTAGMVIPPDARMLPAAPLPDGVPPGPGDDLLEESRPPTLLPDAPPLPSPSAAPRSSAPTQPGPTALQPRRVQTIGHTSPVTAPPRQSPANASWLFASP
jgi:hypothetical protein